MILCRCADIALYPYPRATNLLPLRGVASAIAIPIQTFILYPLTFILFPIIKTSKFSFPSVFYNIPMASPVFHSLPESEVSKTAENTEYKRSATRQLPSPGFSDRLRRAQTAAHQFFL